MESDHPALPEALCKPVETWLERYGERPHADALRRLVACSEFAGTLVLRDTAWFLQNVECFDGPPDPGGLDALVDDGADVGTVKRTLRQFRNRFMLHVLWREVFGTADLDETLRSLSSLADRMLDVATRCAERALAPRFGVVRDGEGRKMPLVIVGMGKLGGCELNFSSDIDLIFLYPDGGETDGARRVSAQEYFGRLVRQVIALLDDTTVDGFVFRVDTRLRPFGDSGPPVVSFAALESYLLQHGRDWERYAYVKARIVGPWPGDDVAAELYDNLVRPFVYRRYIDYGVFESLREMHAMIAEEVRRRELQENVKLGPGGIREAEFIVQSLQLVRGGGDTALQARALQEVLPQLVNSRGLAAAEADRLRTAYRFLRRIENFIQAMQDRQTHDLPRDATGRARLCVAMGYADWRSLVAEIDAQRSAIAEQFDRIAFRGGDTDAPLLERLGRAWSAAYTRTAWRDLLSDEGFADAAGLATTLAAFANAASTRQLDVTSRERLARFIPRLLVEIGTLDAPGAALTRSLGVVERILRRSAYLSLLIENEVALARLVDVCARSSYVADQLARFPALLDELLDPHSWSASVTREDISRELETRPGGAADDSEPRMQAIGRYQRAAMLRIAVADFGGNLPIMKVSDGLTWLAEAVLAEALRVAWRDLASRHGVPCYVVDGARHEAGFGIVAYGKLGGLELSYGSDLDIVFLHDSRGREQATDGEKPLENGLFFGRLVRRLVHFLTMQTGSGQLYEIDTRLRPDGRSGLLVTSTEAFERYQEDNAWTWEHQALLRARPVAGSPAIAGEFSRIRRETLVGRVRRDALREDVIAMRQRMRTNLDRSDAQQFDLKNGRGGIGDIEFLVQFLVLDNAAEHPDVIYFSDNIRQIDALVTAGCMARGDGDALQDAYRAYRLRAHHLVLDDRSPLVPQDEFAALRGFVAQKWDEWLG